MIKKIWHKFGKSDETGQALVLVLILLIVGALIIAPLMANIGTGLIAGEVHEEKANALYAADAGVEDALWQIKNDKLSDLFGDNPPYDPTYGAYDYLTDDWTYLLGEQVNGESVSVTIENIWIPDISPAPDPTTANNTAADERFIVFGTASGTNEFRLRISFDPDAGDMTVQKLGVWLPPGFDYAPGTSNLESDPGNPPYHSVPAPSVSYKGGNKVVWSFASVPFEDFPDVDPADDPMEAEITFQYTDTSGQNRTLEAVSWIETSGVTGISYSWDSDIRVFRITSVAGGTTIEAYALKIEPRQLASAIAGDYYATGNTLMEDTDTNHSSWGDYAYIRDTWVHTDVSIPVNSSSNDVPAESDIPGEGNGIPEDANVKFAYLYWTSWFHPDDIISETRIPTSDGDISGTWNTSPRWDDVDEDETPAHPQDDTNYMTGTTDSGGYMLFSFDSFTIPAGAVITDLTVWVRARDIDSGWGRTGNIRAYIKVKDTYYYSSTSHPTANSFTTYDDCSFSTNPATPGLDWMVEDINGTGSYPLQQFGVYSTDLNPDVQVSMVYAQVNYVVADTAVYFKIDGQQVSFNGTAPQTGGLLTIDPNNPKDSAEVITSIAGYSYSCKKDVTDLILAYAEDDDGLPDDDGDESNDIYHPGIATYTVGGVDGTLGDDNPSRTQMSHAGWSLVIIYSSPTTKGHYLYLYDEFTTALDYDDIDFDEDGQPGGTISGFLVPQRVRNPDGTWEVNAAKMTLFVGEGDDWIAGGSGYPGDFVAFNALPAYWTPPSVAARDIPNSYKLWDGTTSVAISGSNTASSPNNVWNGMSTIFSADGVDVDTFYVTWASGLLQTGYTSAHIDLCTAQDNWNLIYIIISFRSVTTTGGTVTYLIY
jgi:hypothetical protein